MTNQTNQTGDDDMFNTVVKSHRIITAFQNLSLSEMCLIQLAIVDARETEQGLDVNKPLSITAKRYAEVFDIQLDSAYKALSSAGKGLRGRYFTFLDNTNSKIETNWVQQVRYVSNEGRLEIIFTVAVVNEITRLSSHFTQYDLYAIAKLNSIYSVRLYELIIKWLHAKQTDVFNYETLRGQIGIGVNEYKRMTDFKKRVLDLAVSEINEKTDIKVNYEQEKNGTKIVGFRFKVIKKHQKSANSKATERDSDTADMFVIDGLTDKQLGRITRNQQFIADYNHLVSSTSAAGQDKIAWEFEMINRLKRDATQFNKRPIKDYLDY